MPKRRRSPGRTPARRRNVLGSKRRRTTATRRRMRKRRVAKRVVRKTSRKGKKPSSRLAAAARMENKVVTMPKLPNSSFIKFPVSATYRFTLTPKDRAEYMNIQANVAGASKNVQAALGFTVNLNTPHNPITFFDNTANRPIPNNPAAGFNENIDVPAGLLQVEQFLNMTQNTFSRAVICYATDVDYKIERPDDELYERDRGILTGIHNDDVAGTLDDGSHYVHRGNTQEYLHASWISKSQSNFLALDQYHTSAVGQISYNRVDRSAEQTFQRNLKSFPCQPNFSIMRVPQSGKSTWASGSKKWSISHYPAYHPHPLSKDPWSRSWYRSVFDTYSYDFAYKQLATSSSSLYTLADIQPTKVVRMPVIVQPRTDIEEVNRWTFEDGDATTIKDRNDAYLDLPFVRVTLKLKYHLLILTGMQPDGVDENQNPQSASEDANLPLSNIQP